MRIILVICLFFATNLHAGVIRADNNDAPNSTDIVTMTNAPFFAADKLLEKITTSYLNRSDYELIGGNVMNPLLVRSTMCHFLIGRSVLIIGRTEFRAALNFAPRNTSKPHRFGHINDEEFASCPTLEAYYDMKETYSITDNIDEMYLIEKNMPPAIAFLDKRYPSIRIILRRKIQELVRSNNGEMSRKEVDRWIDELLSIRHKITEAFEEMQKNDQYWEKYM